MTDKFRRTGRTTRMLEQAIEASKRGQVLVMVHNAVMVDYCESLLQQVGTVNVKVATPEVADRWIRGRWIAGYYTDHAIWDWAGPPGRLSAILNDIRARVRP